MHTPTMHTPLPCMPPPWIPPTMHAPLATHTPCMPPLCMPSLCSSGSSGRVRGGAEKHEIYAAAFGGHLFYDLFLQGQGGPWPPRPPLDPLLLCMPHPCPPSPCSPPLVDRMTDACENITFPQLLLQTVITHIIRNLSHSRLREIFNLSRCMARLLIVYILPVQVHLISVSGQ